MKKFPGQHKNEKILLFVRENMISYLIRHLNFIFIILGLLVFIIFILYFFQVSNLIIFIASIIYLIISFLFFIFFWYKSFFIVTNKRLIKYIRNGLFSVHIKELKIDQLNELVANKRGILEKLFNFGNIKVTGKAKENVIWVIGIDLPDEVVQYISRLRDYIFENPGYDFNKLKEFKPRKERKLK